MSGQKELLFEAVLKRMKPSILHSLNWEEIASETGYKNAANAKTMFSRFQKKVTSGEAKDSPEGGVQKQTASRKKPTSRKTGKKTIDIYEDSEFDDDLETAQVPTPKRARGRGKKSQAKVEEAEDELCSDAIKPEFDMEASTQGVQDTKQAPSAANVEHDEAEEVV